MFNKKIALIGAGNIGSALVLGLLKSQKFTKSNFIVCKRNVNTESEIYKKGIVHTTAIKTALLNTDIVIIGVLPQQINVVLDELKVYLKPNQLVISVVTGVQINTIKEKLGQHSKVVRAMPNTAISIMQSMTCIAGDDASDEDLHITKTLFDTVGMCLNINEDKMTSATALNSCGIAFFLRAIRAATQGGTEIDFHAEDALLMAAQTAKGAAMLLLENNSHPEEEIDKVTSPRGCTIAGLNHMEHSGFSSAFIKGITTSAQKAKELYK